MRAGVFVVNGEPSYDKTVAFSSATTSSTVDLGGQTLIGIITPSGLTGATWTIQAPTNYDSNGVPDSASPTYENLTDEAGTDVTVVVTADDEHITFSSATIAKLRGVRHLRLQTAGASETATIRLVTAVI